MPRTRSPASITRRRGKHPLDGVDGKGPDDDADAERQDDDDEVLRLEAQHVLGEAGAQDTQDADDRGRDAEVQETPAHHRVGPDVGDPSRSWATKEPIAASASCTAPSWAAVPGGAFGSVQQNPAATR